MRKVFIMNAEILVVDDETTIADLVEVYLKNEGYTVHKFYNGTGSPSASASGRTTCFPLSC